MKLHHACENDPERLRADWACAVTVCQPAKACKRMAKRAGAAGLPEPLSAAPPVPGSGVFLGKMWGRGFSGLSRVARFRAAGLKEACMVTLCVFDAYGTLFDVDSAARQVGI